MTVIWRDKLSIGNQIIDQDHKYLLSLFNSIESCLKEDELNKLPTLFNQLFEYTQEHFSREEVIQLEINFPKFQEHKRKHQHILETLEKTQNELTQLIANQQDNEGYKKAINELHSNIVVLARKWVIDHIIDDDRELIPYIKRAVNR